MSHGLQVIAERHTISRKQKIISILQGSVYTKIRDLLHLIINESLRVGGRPDSAIAEDTDGGRDY